MSSRYGFRSQCTACGSELRRIPRLPDEGHTPGMRRYGCVSEACTWQGLMPRMPARRRALAARRWRRALSRAKLPMLLGVLASAGLAAAVWHKQPAPAPAPAALAPGDHHDGVPLLPSHPLLRRVQDRAGANMASANPLAVAPVAALSLRRACVWGKPGRNPYRGTVEQALHMAALPPEVVREIARQVRAGTPADRLAVANDGIVAAGSGRRFSAQNVALTYGMTLCLGSRVNFPLGHSEPAALYEASDHGGRVYAVMVPEVCGNVSVLGQHATPSAEATPTGDGGQDALRLMPQHLKAGPWAMTADAGEVPQSVPLPGTLVLVLAGLAVLWGSRRMR